MSQKIVTQSTEHPQDPLHRAFTRLHRHSPFTYRMLVDSTNIADLPERRQSFTERIKAAIRRGLRR